MENTYVKHLKHIIMRKNEDIFSGCITLEQRWEQDGNTWQYELPHGGTIVTVDGLKKVAFPYNGKRVYLSVIMGADCADGDYVKTVTMARFYRCKKVKNLRGKWVYQRIHDDEAAFYKVVKVSSR